MGIFSKFSSSSDKYSNKEKRFSEYDIKKLVSSVRIKTLDQNEEKLVEETILKKRGNDGKISLRQIDQSLRELETRKKISKFDKKALMQIFINYFSV
jgi:hypothetical protein